MDKKKFWYIALGDLSKPFIAATIHSREDVRGMAACGWDAVLLSQSDDAKAKPTPNEVPVCKNRPVYYRLIFEFKVVWMLLTCRSKPDFVLFRGTALLLIGLALKFLGIPFGSELPGPPACCIEKKRWWRWRHRSDMFFLKNSDVFITLNQELADIANTYKKSGAVVAVKGVGVNSEEYQVASPLNTDSQSLAIGFLGTLYLDRGLGSIIEALAKLISEDIDTRLVIVGDGEARPMAEQMVKDLNVDQRVTFTGFIPPDKVGDALADVDLMIAIYERTPELVIGGINPMKVWSSLSLGKPVLLYNPGKYNAYDEVPGIYSCPDTDPDTLAQAIKHNWQTIGKTGLAESGIQGRGYVEGHVTWQKHADVINEAIQEYFKGKSE